MLDLITDRTQADAAYAAAHRDSAEPLKGAYNAADFNRVGEALNYLSDLLFSLGYGFNPTLRADWAADENMAHADAAHYLDTVRQVRDSLFLATTPPTLPNNIHEIFGASGHERANDIERALVEVDKISRQLAAYSSQLISGTSYSGDFLRVQKLSRGR